MTNSIFRDYYQMEPDHFCNVTNGIAYRRWLCQANPELTALLKDLIGDGFTTDSTQLEKLLIVCWLVRGSSGPTKVKSLLTVIEAT